MAKISVVLPCYNGLPFLKDTIDSVLKQTETDFELICVDDKSLDQSMAVLLEYAEKDPRVKVWENEKNLGMAENWNKALRLTSGKYIKVMGCDDIIYPACLEKQAAILDAHNDVALVTCPSHVINSQGQILLTRFPLSVKPHGKPYIFSFERLLSESIRLSRNITGEPALIMFRRKDVVRCGLFDHSYRYATDLEYWVRLAADHKVGVAGGIHVGFRVHSSSTTNSVMKWGENELAKVFKLHSQATGIPFDEERFRRSYQRQAKMRSTVFKIADIGLLSGFIHGLNSLRLKFT